MSQLPLLNLINTIMIWTYNAYRATLARGGKAFALLTPDGRNALEPEKVAVLLQALNGGKKPRPPASRSAQQMLETTYEDGHSAGLKGKLLEDCPYPASLKASPSRLRSAWIRGLLDARNALGGYTA